MPRIKKTQPVPLGLADQVSGFPTAPTDRGDETQERFRYQWAIGTCLLAEGLSGQREMRALWCEHHDDYLVELADGHYVAVQVKTDGGENAVWRLTDSALIDSIARFCTLERQHGVLVEGYEFMSNAGVYVPGALATSDDTVARSPARLMHCCKEAGATSEVPEPYLSAFKTLCAKTGTDEGTLFAVLRKLCFRQGPPLRGYDDSLAVQVIPSIPGCKSLLQVVCCRLRDELIGLVEGACRLAMPGIDGVIAFLASNGRPEAALRGKCIAMQSALELIGRLQQPDFRFVNSGEGLRLGNVPGRADVLQRKMRNAYIGGQFESLRLRMDSAEQRLMERALLESEGFEAVAEQLVGAVLVECKDAEAMAIDHSDEKTLGPAIYKQVLLRMDNLATQQPARVCREPKDTLIGVAGMLSGECRFAWGVALEEAQDGA